MMNLMRQTKHHSRSTNGFVLSIVFPLLRIVGSVATALMVYFGAISVLGGYISAGAWYLFLSTLEQFLFPVFSVASFWTNVQTGLSAAERIFALIDAEHSVKQIDHVVPERIEGHIEMKPSFSVYA